MSTFKVTRVAYDVVHVEATTAEEAEQLACNMDGDAFQQTDTVWEVEELHS